MREAELADPADSPLKHRSVLEIQGVKTQKTILPLLTAERTVVPNCNKFTVFV
jgi:hypothetical protein